MSIKKYKNYIWFHAKNLNALSLLKDLKLRFFWHQNDDYTITSNGFFWTFPNKTIKKNCICVMPEKYDDLGKDFFKNCDGICSDFILKYKDQYDKINNI